MSGVVGFPGPDGPPGLQSRTICVYLSSIISSNLTVSPYIIQGQREFLYKVHVVSKDFLVPKGTLVTQAIFIEDSLVRMGILVTKGLKGNRAHKGLLTTRVYTLCLSIIILFNILKYYKYLHCMSYLGDGVVSGKDLYES